MKRLALMLIHWYQFAMNYPLYWYFRDMCQMGGELLDSHIIAQNGVKKM